MTSRPSTPIGNTSKEAVALRTAAIDFGEYCLGSKDPDPYDRRGVHLNRLLLKAATAYAEAMQQAKKAQKSCTSSLLRKRKVI